MAERPSEHGVRVGRSYPSPRLHAYEQRGLPAGAPPMPDGPPAPLPGFGPPTGRNWGVNQGERARALQSWLALRQRIALGAGPTADRWSSYQGGLTPELIVQCRKEAQAGYPWRWVDLCESQLQDGYATKSFLHFRRAWIYAVPHSVDPPEHFKGDDLAKDLCSFQMAIINGLRSTWKETMYGLLSAAAYGYAAAEIFWDWRTISFRRSTGEEVTIPGCWVPVGLKAVHQKHFMFQIDDGDPLLWVGQGQPGARWPKGKLIFNRAVGDGIIERRGFMTAGIWINMAMQHGWRDLLIWMHLYGLPQFGLAVEKAILDQDEEWAIVQDGLAAYGQGKIPVWLNEVKVEPLGQVTGEPVHPDILRMGEMMLSLLIVGSILAQTQGDGTGAYNAGDIHASTAHIYRLPDGGALETALETDLLGPALEFNIAALSSALNSASRSVGPEEIRARSKLLFGWKAIDKAPSVTDVIGHYRELKDIGFPISMSEISQRTGYAIGAGEDAIKVLTSSGGNSSGPGLQLTATAQGAITTVDEARGQLGLTPWPDGTEGALTVAEFTAKHGGVIAEGAAATEGTKPGSEEIK